MQATRNVPKMEKIAQQIEGFFFAFSHPNSWISSGWYKKRCSWDWKVIDRSYCHISCYLNGGIHSDVASFSLGVPLLVCMYSPYHCEPTLYGCQSQLCQPGRTAKILAPHKHQDHWNRSAAFVLLHYLYIETLWVVVVGWFGSGCFGISVSIIE